MSNGGARISLRDLALAVCPHQSQECSYWLESGLEFGGQFAFKSGNSVHSVHSLCVMALVVTSKQRCVQFK